MIHVISVLMTFGCSHKAEKPDKETRVVQQAKGIIYEYPAHERRKSGIDDLFCNGVKRCDGEGKHCTEGPPPCDDGDPCTVDLCDEVTQRCSYEGESCAECFSDCVPSCTGFECGDDGCGGSCGDCASGTDCVFHQGTCELVGSTIGSCPNPIALASTFGVQVVSGDTSDGLTVLVPSCNSTSTATELVYSFVVTSPGTGLEARVSGYDTVLTLLSDDCASTIDCSDDSSPPGNFGSRVTASLDPGTYYLVVDGFDSESYGPFELTVELVDGCVPACDGVFCGDNGCGGSCGFCGDGESCATIPGTGTVCVPDSCTPDCAGKTCGDDGCGGSCGDCTGGELCVSATGTCAAFPVCDHLNPVCAGDDDGCAKQHDDDDGCADTEFCASDCACHSRSELLPDLVVSAEFLGHNEISHEYVSPESCEIVEACVDAPGDRTILRFDMLAINQGQSDLVVPDPATRPDLFEFSPCHAHYHYEDFASYALVDASGNVVAPGHKQSFCMEDTIQAVFRPGVNCQGTYDCDYQGISAGHADLYGSGLDCQGIDVTDVPSGDYILRVDVNPGRLFPEISFENNSTSIPVHIP